MMTQLHKSFCILLALLLMSGTLAAYGSQSAPDDSSQELTALPEPPPQAGMPDELMSAFLAASSQPFEPSAEGFRAHSGGLDFTLDRGGLKARGEGWTWDQTLSGFGREGQIVPVSVPEIATADRRLEYRRDALTEWYRATALGLEQGFKINEAPPGEGPLILQLDVSASFEGLAVTADAGNGGLLFALPAGQTLHYDHLRAWEANGASLDANLSYTAGQVILEVNDQMAAYPITVDPLIYIEHKVTANEGAAGDYFGISMALSGDTALVGAAYDDVGANGDQGSVYVFTRSWETWTQEAQLTASDGEAHASFGWAVALSDATALVGAPGDVFGANANQGSAYVFTRSGATWTQQAKLAASDGVVGDAFGYSVALSGDTALVGAAYDNVDGNTRQGSATVFTRSETTWSFQQQLTALDGAAGDLFGASVALSGDTALVGAYEDDVQNYANQGSAIVFIRSGTTWIQQARLTASNGAVGDYFGASVALSDDMALVGAPGDDISENTNQGSAYVFTRNGTNWSFQQRLTASNGAAGDYFGISSALSDDTALVGAFWDDDQGSAYIFTYSGATWTQQAQLTANDGEADDEFGISTALSGDTAMVGAFWDDVDANPDQGSVYVFTRSETDWTEETQLITGGAAGDSFGSSVAISGDTALVGAAYDNVGTKEKWGSVYVFTRSGTGWTRQGVLTNANGGFMELFGASVALSGDTALVGAWFDFVGAYPQGSAYIFTRSGTTWSFQQQLTAADGAAFDWFGWSVALSGDTALAGAHQDDVGGNSSQGSAYVFVRNGTTWTQQAQLIADDGAAGDAFGYAAALSGDTALVGAASDDVGANADQGSAYVFTRTGTEWIQQGKLTASDGAAFDFFGGSVALSGDIALVGASQDDIGPNTEQGSAYVFTRNGTAWTQQAKLTASDGRVEDYFGASVALSDDMALVGAAYDDVGTNENQGSAYVFTRSGTEWSRQGKLTASDGRVEDYFGASVALSDDMALVGAAYDDVGTNENQGSAYVFTRSGTEWSRQGKLTASDGRVEDFFGASVVLSDDMALVGAVGADVGAIPRGSAYFFDITIPTNLIYLPVVLRSTR